MEDGASRARLPTEDAVQETLWATRASRAFHGTATSHREVIFLRDIQQLTAPEAPRISFEMPKSRLHRGRVSLRELVASDARNSSLGEERPD